MPEPVVVVTMGAPVPTSLQEAERGAVRGVDCYQLCARSLAGAQALLVGIHVDQRHLAGCRGVLEAFVGGGGRAVVCGQVAVPFLAGLAPFRPLVGYGVDDLVVRAVEPHPVWYGVDAVDLTFRRGVAGFYGRGWHQPPSGAQVVNALGPACLPLDYVYALGAGEVLVHGGNDLWEWGDVATSASRLIPQLLDWARS